MKDSFHLFGDALLAYLHKDKTKFYFEDKQGNKYEQSVSGYFDKNKPFTKLERKMISLSRGKILDVGCGTGGFIPHLSKKGDVLGIDISPSMIKICKERGFKNVKVADIFKFKPKNKYDTILLLDENIGLVETVNKAKKLLKKLSKLLAPNGKILANAQEAGKKDYDVWEARALWKKQHGPWFKWIKFNSRYLTKICNEQGLRAQIIERDGVRYIVKITHRQK